MERAHKGNPATLFVLLATAFVVTAVWAATGLAGGDSSSASTDPGSSRPAVEFAQAEEEAAPREDCPEEDGSAGSSGSDDSSGSSSTDF